MRTLEPANRVRIGLMAIVLSVLVTAVGQSFTSVPMLFAEPRYYGEFTDSGGLRVGDKVRIAGMEVGKVQELKLAKGYVLLRFTLGSNRIGDQSRMAIRTDTILGRKVLEIEPRGDQLLRPGARLPIIQTATPYQLYDAFRDATKAVGGWDLRTVRESLSVLSQTVDQTSPHLNATLNGVQKFADVVAKRDERVQVLLGETSKVAGVLGIHGEQINRLLVNAESLLVAINQRSQAIEALLTNLQSTSTQVRGLIEDNPKLSAVLHQVEAVSDVLVERKDDLVATVSQLGRFVASLSEIVSSGPYVKAAIFNLVPGQLMQPFVDAAFKGRGIDPGNFWQGAGLPAFQWPDPNGTRMPNGAPPPAPTVHEGTPEFPGPAVPPGSPCAYTPAAGAQPSAANPLPCAGVDTGPFGGFGLPGPIGVDVSAPNPGAAAGPGIPVAAIPGAAPPDVPGTPVPLPAAAPPGARVGVTGEGGEQ